MEIEQYIRSECDVMIRSAICTKFSRALFPCGADKSSFLVMVPFPYFIKTTTLGGKELSILLLLENLSSLGQRSCKQCVANQVTGRCRMVAPQGYHPSFSSHKQMAIRLFSCQQELDQRSGRAASWNKIAESRDGIHNTLEGEVVYSGAISHGPGTSEGDSVWF